MNFIKHLESYINFINIFTDVFETTKWKGFHTADPYLGKLKDKLPNAIKQSKAGNTVKQYSSEYNKWKRWTDNFREVSPLPASDFHVALYLLSLVQSANSASVIVSARYGIKWAHDLACVSPNPCDSFLVNSVVESAKRSVRHQAVKKEVIDAGILRLFVDKFVTERSNLKELRDVTMFLLAYAAFLRFDELSNIKGTDIVFHDTYFKLFIESSKTDKYRDGAWLLIAKTGNKTCPYDMLKRYLLEAEIDSRDKRYIFRSVTFFKKSNNYKLRSSGKISYSNARDILLKKLKLVGFSDCNFGLHSLRSGGATAAANRGIQDRLFKRHGRWLSDRAKDGYIKDKVDERLAVTLSLGI